MLGMLPRRRLSSVPHVRTSRSFSRGMCRQMMTASSSLRRGVCIRGSSRTRRSFSSRSRAFSIPWRARWRSFPVCDIWCGSGWSRSKTGIRHRLPHRHGGGADDEDGSDDSNFNRFHLRLDDGRSGPSRRPSSDDDGFGGRADDDDDSGNSNCNRYNPGIDRCHDGKSPQSP